jgi:acyl-CoA synthetase (AMP-forming)/AMP-acid ligase II
VSGAGCSALDKPGLVDLLEDAAAGAGSLRLIPDGTATSFADLWKQSGLAARWLASRVDDGAVVAAVMSTSVEALACLVGGWRAGLTVASLPTPARSMSVDEYRAQIETLCRLVGAKLLLVDEAHVSLFSTAAVEVSGIRTFTAPGRRLGPAREATPGSFVQLTSGTTSTPRGVHLSMEAMAANVLAVLEALAPARGDTSCSWLPLSHDLGLVGMCLVPWVANSPGLLGRADAVLLQPRQFGSWMAACADARAAFTAAPNFALALARNMLRRADAADLSCLRACIVGGETVRASTLTAFAEVAATLGLREGVLCPAYGLAEATLGVSMVRPGDRWTSRTVDPAALADGSWEEVEDGRILVGNGQPLSGVEVRVAGPPGRVGPIEIRSPALMDGYVGAAMPTTGDGWLRTHDLGYLDGEEVYVSGRADDIIVVGGRNLYAQDLELEVERVKGIRPNNVVAIDDDEGRYLVVAESLPGVDPRPLAEQVRASLVRRVALGPSAVVFVRRGSLPKTPSGKPQRHKVRALRAVDGLEAHATVEFPSVTT